MDLTGIIEIFACVTGVLYIVLEILQKNAMWGVGVLTGAACAVSFAIQHNWGMVGLNLYYVVISVVGFFQWRRDGAKVESGAIHVAALPRKVAIWSAAGFVLGSLAFIWLLRLLGDGASELDAVASVLSVIATWWLTRSYPQQWLLWIVADALTALLCLSTGQFWLLVLYLAYAGSAIYGYVHWQRKGVRIPGSAES